MEDNTMADKDLLGASTLAKLNPKLETDDTLDEA